MTQSRYEVTVTRHPLSRFASAWAQKFQKNGEFDKNKKEWLTKWPQLTEFDLLNDSTHRISFKSFLNYFIQKSSPQKFNPHWRLASGWHKQTNNCFVSILNFSDACEVCKRPYEYIVKEETADSDLIYLTWKYKLDLPDSFFVTMKGKSRSSNNLRSYTSWDDIYNGIGDSRKLQWILSDIELENIKKLVKMYDNDFRLFGYSFNFEFNELGGLTWMFTNTCKYNSHVLI